MTNDSTLPRVLHLDEFVPFVGQTLWADCDPAPVPLALIEATPLMNRAGLDRPPFLLVFRSAPEALLMSAEYVMRGERFGPVRISLMQLARPSAGSPGHYYQAVFN